MSTNIKFDFLDEDEITVPNQHYAIVSVVGPKTNQKYVPEDIGSKCAVKIRGVFRDQELANKHAQKIQRLDKSFDIYVVDMYKWLLMPPDLNKIEDQEYQESGLNSIIKGYKEQQMNAKQLMEERKQFELEEAMKIANEAHEEQKLMVEEVKKEMEEAKKAALEMGNVENGENTLEIETVDETENNEKMNVIKVSMETGLETA